MCVCVCVCALHKEPVAPTPTKFGMKSTAAFNKPLNAMRKKKLETEGAECQALVPYGSAKAAGKERCAACDCTHAECSE